jgi:hypothetical protein
VDVALTEATAAASTRSAMLRRAMTTWAWIACVCMLWVAARSPECPPHCPSPPHHAAQWSSRRAGWGAWRQSAPLKLLRGNLYHRFENHFTTTRPLARSPRQRATPALCPNQAARRAPGDRPGPRTFTAGAADEANRRRDAAQWAGCGSTRSQGRQEVKEGGKQTGCAA